MKNKTELPTISVCIPAHNEALTIGPLLRSLLKQKTEICSLAEIIIYSDASTDQTVERCQALKDSRVKCIVGKKQIGQLQAIATMLRNAQGDIIVLLDADIALYNDLTLQKLVTPLLQDPQVGLVGGNPIPTPPHTFIEATVQTSINAYKEIAAHTRGGSNPYNCHGCILALSAAFAKTIEFPKEIFSGDTYLYFSCLHQHYHFQYAPEAKVLYRVPNNLKDVIKQYTRFLDIDSYSQKKFGSLLAREYAVDTKIRLHYLLAAFISQPLHTCAMYVIKVYCQLHQQPANASGIWEAASSTKQEITYEF